MSAPRQSVSVVAAALAMVLTGCAVVEPVYIHIDTAAPLSCVVSRADPVPLIHRVIAPEHRERDVLFVFDFLRTIDRGACSPGDLLDDCESAGCTALPEARACLRVPRGDFIGLGPAELDSLLLSHFVEGTPRILEDGPEGVVLPRITIVLADDAAPPCPAPGEPSTEITAFDPDLLLGCGYACPITLDGSSRVDLDFDAVMGAAVCDLAVVRTCADLGVGPRPAP